MRRKSAFLVVLWLAEVNIAYCPEIVTHNQNEGECSLSSREIGGIEDFAEATWTVDDAFLAVHQLQDVLDCAKNGETVALNLSKTYVPKTSLVIQTQITIRPSHALEAAANATLTCPTNYALMLVKNASVVLENIVIKDCWFHSHLHFNSIIRLKCSRKRGQAFVLNLLNIGFWNNYNQGGSTGINMENPECFSVTMKNATFRNNDVVYGSELTNKNDMKKALALWRAPVLLELDPSRDLKEEEEETIIVASALTEVGNCSLVLRVSDVNNDGITLNVTTLKCLIDEFLHEDSKQCIKCEEDYYNFYPLNETCKKCPRGANCSGEYVLLHDGHWNSFPCSTHVQECLNRDACQGLERSEVKEIISVNDTTTCDLSEDEIKRYRDAQCDKGYQGLLCGACKKDYGKIELYDCIPCQNRVLIFIAMIISMFMLIYSTLEQTAASLEMIKTRWMRRLERPSREEREANVQQALQRSEHFEEYVAIAQTAKEQFVLVMQIRLNFMQAMGACLSIYREWDTFLPKVITASNWINLNVSQVYRFSFDCLLPTEGDMPRSVTSTMLAILLPFAVIGIFCAYWLYNSFKVNMPWKNLAKRCILSSICVLYVCHLSLTKIVLSTFSCVKVFDAVSLDDKDSFHSYGVADTLVRCRQGNHAVISMLSTIPVIIFVVVIMLVLARVLLVDHERNALHSEWIRETLGVLFIGFRAGFEIWGFMILLRKALIAELVVLNSTFPSMWHGIAMTILCACYLVSHLLVRPYRTRFENLNSLEGIFLFVCVLNALISTILANQRVSFAFIKASLAVILFVTNAVNVIVYGYHLVMNKFIEIKYTLLLKGVVNEDDKTIVVLLKSWEENLKGIQKLLGAVATIIYSSFDLYRFESDDSISASLLPSSSNT